jgi:Na+-transporting NADH:ubiquinone oxidoreductase subunit NqrE
VSELLFWALGCVLFFMAVACAVFGAFVRREEHHYLFWAAWAAWAVLCLALALVMGPRLL